jgi:KipI family sensor histidine kinase inhibitor
MEALTSIGGSGARYLPAGDAALVVEFGDSVDCGLNARVLAAAAAIRAAALPGVVEVVPTFRSLMVHLDPLVTDPAALATAIGGVAFEEGRKTGTGRTVHIPVLYGGEAGPDLEALAAECGLTPDEVVRRHAGTRFHAYMLGFLPGFAYLGDLPTELRVPRLSEPRLRVPVGSVGIAGELTAVYPSESPGGWRLIGRTPLPLFDPAREQPSLLQPGDHVRFDAVDAEQFEAIAAACAAGRYQPKTEFSA